MGEARSAERAGYVFFIVGKRAVKVGYTKKSTMIIFNNLPLIFLL